METVLCEHCTAVCCKYLALPIEKPTTRRDFDDIRWYLMHGNVSIFVEDGDWYIQFATPCRYLEADTRCGVYATRPRICREYKAGECDYESGPYSYELYFTRPEQIESYAADWERKRRAERRRKTRKHETTKARK